jgi:hypothetical protein
MFGFTLAIWLTFGVAMQLYFARRAQESTVEQSRNLYVRQLDPSDTVAQEIRERHWRDNNVRGLASGVWGVLGIGVLVLGACAYRPKEGLMRRSVALLAFAPLFLTGCWQPFEPVDLQTIGPNEEGFLIPWTGDTRKQSSTNNEEFLRANLVSTKQIRIPKQWVPHGYETIAWNGEWKDAAVLIKVDKSPVTREWTADPATGTSSKNEAIWVMTADQVEFSTGWTCTARIASRDDAVKFLHNYPNGALAKVMDSEVRAKLQADFGIEVTDLPMDTLRKNATPHILKVRDGLIKFFGERGITITNLGITGGFIYKDPSIQAMLVKVFNSEQERNIAIAKTQAQEELNKQVLFEAEGRAKAILAERKAEADGIKAVADAKAYEIKQAQENLQAYLTLKRLELETKKLERWDGKFPTYFMGAGSGATPDLLLQVPSVALESAKEAK